METQDPDDFFTLSFLSGHPSVDLMAVTIVPGSKRQVWLVKWLLNQVGLEIPVGSFNVKTPKDHVSVFHEKIVDEKMGHCEPDDSAHNIINEIISKDSSVIFLTGAPVKNLKKTLTEHPDLKIDTWVAQGGFAGESVMPPENVLDKFRGMERCQTFNFNGDINGARLALSSERIKKRFLVSKNICHGVVYDEHVHRFVGKYKDRWTGLNILHNGMGIYLAKKKEGKKFHDSLAACVAIDRDICEFREVSVYHRKDGWGSSLCEGTNTFISVDVDQEKFWNTLIGNGGKK